MKTKSAFRLVRTGSRRLATALVSLLAAHSTGAAIYYWDATNPIDTAGFGTAAGTWGTSSYWTTADDGSATPGTAATATTDALNFGYLTTGLGAGTIAVGTVDAGDITFAVGSGTIVLSGGTITLAAAETITVDNASDTIGSVLAGAATSLTKLGTGTLTLSGVNTYTGATLINAGILRATTNANALGTGAATLTLAGGNLQLANDSGLGFARNTTVSANALITSDRLAAGAGVTHTLGTLTLGANTLGIARGANVSSGTAGVTFGATTLSGAANLNLSYGTLLTLGALTDNGYTTTLQGGGNFAQSGVWGAGTGGLTLDTTYRGTATLSQANTFTGVVTLKNGTLAANGNAGALGAGTLDLQGGILDLNNATGLAFNRDTTVNANTTIVAEKNAAGVGVTYTLGTLNINGAYALAIRGGNVNSGTAGLTFGATTLSGNSVIDTWNPTVGSSTSSVPGNVLLTLGAVTGNGYSLTKNGSGTLLSAETSGTPFGDGNLILNGGTLALSPTGAATGLTGVNAAVGSTLTYRSGTLQLTRNGANSLAYTLGNAGAAADSVLVRDTRGTLILGVTALANLQTTEQFMVNGQTAATNKDGNASSSGIYDASLVAQQGTGNTGVGSFVVADTVANGGFKLATYTTAVTGTTIAANTISDVTGSIAINTASNPYALRVGAFTLTNSGTTTINGGAAGATNSGLGGVILNPTATNSLITGGTLAFGASEGVVYVGSGAGNGTIASQITGSAGLTKFGPGTLALTNTTSNFTGGTTINGGTLWITNEAQLGTAASININGGATLLIGDSGNSPSLAAARNIVLGAGIQNIVKWTKKTVTINGIISGSGGVNFGDTTAWGGDGGGGGRFQLYAANTYTGDTILTYTGTKDPGIVVNNTLALQYTTVDYNTTNIPNGINAGSMIMWGVPNPVVGGFKGNRDWNMSYQTNPVTMNIGNNNQDTLYSGNLSSSNTSTKLVKIGTGTLTLAGNNTYAGVTEVQNGTLVLSGTNTTNGNTLISGGTLLVANNLALQNSAFDTASTGTLSFVSGIDTPTIGGLTGSANFTLPANIIALTLNPQAAKTYSGALASTTAGMNVTKMGNFAQLLSGQNLYTGNTILTGTGALQMGADPVGSVGSITSSAIGRGGLVFNGGTLSSGNTTARTVLNPVSFTGNATLGDVTNNGKLSFSAIAELGTAGRTLTTSSEVQFDGAINGVGGGITKAGASILTLAGNNTYTGLTTVSAGKLILSGNNAAATGGMTLSGGVTQFNSAAAINGTARNVTLNSPGTLVFDTSFGAGDIPAALLNRIVAASTGTIAADNYLATNFDFNTAGLSAASLGVIVSSTYTGTLTPHASAGYRLGGAGGTLTLSNSNALTGTNALTVIGNVILAAANNNTGVTTITASSTLTLDAGVTGVGSTSIVANGTLVFNNATTQSFGGIISGSGALTKIGAGTLTLAGPQAYTGATTVNAGTLVLAGNHTLAVNKALVVNTGGTLDLGSNRQYGGQLSGTGGSVTGSGGTLTIQQAGNTNVTYAGTIDGSINVAVIRGIGVDGNGSNNLNLTNNSPTTGTLTLLGGDNPTAQPSGYDKGTFNGIALNDAGRLSGVSAITLNNGSLFINNSASYAPNGGTAMTSNQNLTDRVNDAAAITLNGGKIWFKGRDSTASTETLGDSTHGLTVSTGMGVIYAYAGASGSAELTLASLARSSGAALNVDGTSLGTTGNASRIQVTGGVAALTGNLAPVGSVGVGIVPGVFAGNQTAVPLPVGYVDGKGFVALGVVGGPTSYTGTLAAALDSSNVYNPSAAVVKAGGQTINSLVQNASITFDATTPGVLTLASGMLIQGVSNMSIGTATTRGQLTSGLASGELFLTKSNGAGGGQTLGNTKIESVITDNGGTRVKLVVDQYCRDNLNANFCLYAPNTYSGGTVVSGGNTLYLYGAAEASGVAPIPAANDPAQGLILNNSSVTMQTTAQQIAASNIVTLNGGSKLTLVGANNTLAGLVFNSNGGGGRTQGSVPTVTGGTKMTITGNITSTPTDPSVTPLISNTTLDLNATASHDITVSALPEGNYVNNGATSLALNGLTISSVISNGGFTKKGTGVLNLTGNNTFAGQLTVEEGVLNVATVNNVSANGVLGNSASAVMLGGSGGKTGTLEYTGGNTTSSKPFTLATGGSGAFQVDSAGTELTLSGQIDGSGGLAKTGAGVLTLSTAKSYSGDTTVKAGTLILGASGSIAYSPKITVGDAGSSGSVLDVAGVTGGFAIGGTQALMGIGKVNGAVTISDGGIHTAGDAVTVANTSGAGTIGNQAFSTGITYNQGSILEWNLTANTESTIGTRGINYDAVNTAALATSGSGAIFRVVLNGSQNFSESFWEADRTWTDIFTNVAGTTSLDIASIFSSVQTYNASGSTTPAVGSFAISGSSLTWTYSAVPEVSNLLAGLLLGAGLLRRRR